MAGCLESEIKVFEVIFPLKYDLKILNEKKGKKSDAEEIRRK